MRLTRKIVVPSLHYMKSCVHISVQLNSARSWANVCGEPNAIDYAKFFSRSHDPVIRVYDEAGNVIQTHEHKGEFKEW
jgi:hypothetical protein